MIARALAVLTLVACGGSQPADPTPAPIVVAPAPDAELAPIRVEIDAGHAETPVGRVVVQMVSKAVEPASDLSGDAVASKVQRLFLAGLERCYQDTLASDPTVAGTARIALDVDVHGQAQHVHVTGPTDELARCAEHAAAIWTFAPPKAPDGAATTAALVVTISFAID